MYMRVYCVRVCLCVYNSLFESDVIAWLQIESEVDELRAPPCERARHERDARKR